VVSGKCNKGDGQKRADTNSYESDHGTSFQGRDPTGEEGQSERRKSKSAEPSTASERMSDQSSGVRYARNKVPNKPSKTGGGKTSSESADPIRAGLGKSVPQSDEKAPEKYSEKHEKHSGKSDKHSDKSVKHAGKGLRTSASEMDVEVPGSPEIAEVTSDVLGDESKDPVFVPVSVPQGITAFETQDNAGFQKAVNQLAGSINPPFVLGIQGRPGTSTDNGSTFGAQGVNPGSNQPFCPPRPVDMQPPRSGYPQWPPYQ